MRDALRAGAAYFVAVFALGFVLGTVRVLWLAPAFGASWATALELPVMIAASWLLCGGALRRWQVPARIGARLAMGALAFLLLMLAEVTLGVGAFDRTFAEQVHEMTSGPGLAGLLAQVGYAAFPVVRMLRGID